MTTANTTSKHPGVWNHASKQIRNALKDSKGLSSGDEGSLPRHSTTGDEGFLNPSSSVTLDFQSYEALPKKIIVKGKTKVIQKCYPMPDIAEAKKLRESG